MLTSFVPVVLFWKCQLDYLRAKQRFNKERFQLAENLRRARCSPFVISKVLPPRTRTLITARARKNKRTARMLANARKDHSIPLFLMGWREFQTLFVENRNDIMESNFPRQYLISPDLWFSFINDNVSRHRLFVGLRACINYRPRLFEKWITLSTG